jgi:hypothetical protein
MKMFVEKLAHKQRETLATPSCHMEKPPSSSKNPDDNSAIVSTGSTTQRAVAPDWAGVGGEKKIARGLT